MMLLAMGLYVAVVLAISVWATRRTRSARDFFVAGGGLGVVTMGIASMAATLSGFAFIGGPGLIYSVGLGAVFIVLPASLTNTMSAWVLGKRLRLLAEVREILTIPDALAARFDSRAVQGMAGVAILAAVIGYTATNVLALGLVLEAVLGLTRTPALWLGALLMLAYSVSGGILAGVYNDVFQGTLMAVASVLIFVLAVKVGGGVSQITQTLAAHDARLVSPWGTLSPMAALSFFFVFGIGTLGQPHVVHKFLMLRDPLKLRWYPLVMTVAMTTTLLLFVIVGLVMKALVVSGQTPALARPDDATPTFLRLFTPAPVAGLVFAAVAAAIMSTVNSFLSVGAAACTRDVPRALGLPVRDELRTGRWWTVVLMLGATLLAQVSTTLVAFLGVFGFGLFASTLTPALALGLNWHGATRTGALASIGVGLVLTLGLEALAFFGGCRLPAGVTPAALALALSLATFVVVSWVTRAEARAELADDIRAVLDA